MQIVQELAGYSLGRSDMVRRAMSKKKADVMAKERENFKDALASLQPDILKLASFLNKENENKGDLESTLDLQWALAKRGRPSLDDKPLIRTTILLTEEDKEKLKVLGGSSWIRNQIRMARIGEIQ